MAPSRLPNSYRSNPEWVTAVATLLDSRVRIRMNGWAGTTHHSKNMLKYIMCSTG